MLANDSSAAYVEARREPAIDTEGLASCSSADDIDNGVDCAHLVDLTPKEYEHVRADPRRFFVLRGHEIPDVETVVEQHAGYVVVEKRDEAGEAAEARDPRA